jgi:drug/metabolite transporter (DMT)-like permease
MNFGVLPAMLTAVFFGVTPVVAGRAIKLIGFVRANLVRLAFAVVVMGAWAFAFGLGLRGQLLLFVTAGAIGFGLGGLSLLAALPRLGAPLTSLIEETIAAPIAGVVAWFWYQEKLTTNQVLFSGLILVGVAIGLAPYVRATVVRGVTRAGVALGVGLALLAALGQGVSFAATRNGLLQMKAAHKALPAINPAPDVVTVAFQRLAGGLAVAIVVYLVARWIYRRRWGFATAEGTTRSVLDYDGRTVTSRPLFWGALNALFGPILGVTCTVWAQLTLPAAQVQSIAAVAPLIAVPFAFWLEGHKPPRLWYVGALVAIVGLVAVDLATL